MKWERIHSMSWSGQGPGRTSPSQDISSNPPKDTPRMHCLPPPGNRLTSNHLIGFSGTISKGISREWEFYKIECYHVSDEKTVFLVSLHLSFALNSVCILYVVCVLNPVCSMQSEFCTDCFPKTWTPKMAKHHEISEYVLTNTILA